MTATGQADSPVRIVEVGPRDGLQNERALLPTETKVAFIEALAKTGVAEVEIGSFVAPQAVPQLADTDRVARALSPGGEVIYSALVPNERGLERALASGLKKIAVFTAASDTFTRHNIRVSIAESLERFKPVVAHAKASGLAVRGYISTVVFCPYEGRIAPGAVADVIAGLRDLGVDEVSLGETLGKAAPVDIRRLLDQVLRTTLRDRIALHLHDTYGMAVANALVAWSDYGITTFDAAAGGLGGCPYAPGASGNVATEDLVYALKASGARVAVDGAAVARAALALEPALGRPLRSRLAAVYGRAGSPVRDPEPATKR